MPTDPQAFMKQMEALSRSQGVGPSNGVRYLSSAEAKGWRARIEKTSLRACQPLRFSQANGDDMPLPLEVVRNDKNMVVVHFFRRPDIAVERAEPVIKAALLIVFGPPSESMRDPKTGEVMNCFYRDEEEIKNAQGLKRKVLPSDSWYIEFPAGLSMILPNTDYLRDRLASAVKSEWLKTEPLTI